MAGKIKMNFKQKVLKRTGEKLYKTCKYKGTFINCGPNVCLSCHRDSLEEIAKKMNKLWFVRAWKRYVKLKSKVWNLLRNQR